jgi:hypothetical protein
MKNLFFILLLVSTFIFLLCDNKDMDEETGPFSLIGTWEAEGEFIAYGGSKYTCKTTLVFLDDINFEDETIFISFTRPPSKHEGTYTRTDDNIIYKDIIYKEDGSINFYNTYTYKYHFANKNTLETLAIGTAPELNDKATFKRKN